MKTLFLLTAIGSVVVSVTTLGQGRGNVPMPTSDRIPSSLMTFFVTSEPIGDGGNLGGLAGADAHCQMLAARVGAGGKTWRAYLSTQARPDQTAVNARDRIGTGPWDNAKERIPDYLGRRLQRPIIQSEIHGDTLDEARRGSNLTKEFAITEKASSSTVLAIRSPPVTTSSPARNPTAARLPTLRTVRATTGRATVQALRKSVIPIG
jgi:hypothetical protein